MKFPINEPAEGRRKSQIEEYLEFYHSSGVQHIAMATDDILKTVALLKQQGVEFLSVPHSYYEELHKRVGKVDEPISELEKLGILVDRDEEGYMLQILRVPRRPAHAVLRNHSAQRQPQLWQGKLQGALRGHREGAGSAWKPVR